MRRSREEEGSRRSAAGRCREVPMAASRRKQSESAGCRVGVPGEDPSEGHGAVVWAMVLGALPIVVVACGAVLGWFGRSA